MFQPKLILAAALVCFWAFPVKAADTNAVLTSWFAAQAALKTWSADFVQTRTLKTFTQPLSSTGRIWFAMPNSFRWELGSPPQTIAVRQADQLMVYYPRLKRAEKYALSDKQLGQWRDAIALLEAGFPRHRAELEAQFRLLTLTDTPAGFELTMQPKSTVLRRMISEIQLAFQTNDFSLAGTELKFGDGSRMRNDFKHPIRNPTLPEGIFDLPLGPDVRVVEPLKR